MTARYAVACNRKVDVIAVTMLDQLALLPALYVSTGYLMPSRLADEGGAYLETEPREDAAVDVRGIRPVCPQSPRLTALLAECRPLLALLARRDTGPPERAVLRIRSSAPFSTSWRRRRGWVDRRASCPTVRDAPTRR